MSVHQMSSIEPTVICDASSTCTGMGGAGREINGRHGACTASRPAAWWVWGVILQPSRLLPTQRCRRGWQGR